MVTKFKYWVDRAYNRFQADMSKADRIYEGASASEQREMVAYFREVTERHTPKEAEVE